LELSLCKEDKVMEESILHQLEENDAFRDGLADRLMLVEPELVGAQFGIISCSVDKAEAPAGLRLVAWAGISKILTDPTEFNMRDSN
jgi:hypothetical protein